MTTVRRKQDADGNPRRGSGQATRVLTGLAITIVLVTHDLPYALQLCRRSVLLNRGRVVADDDTPTILGNGALLTANRLELPYGFDVGLLATSRRGLALRTGE